MASPKTKEKRRYFKQKKKILSTREKKNEKIKENEERKMRAPRNERRRPRDVAPKLSDGSGKVNKKKRRYFCFILHTLLKISSRHKKKIPPDRTH